MQTLLTQFATVLLLAGVAFTLFALRKTIRQFRQSRRASYYILREEAARSAGRWAIVTIVAAAATIALAVYASRATPAPAPTPTATATIAVPTVGAVPTHTPKPTDTPIPAPTDTPTLTPTATIAPHVPEALLTPIPNAATPNLAARFEFLTLASRLDADLNPVDPGLQFPEGASRVYVFFRASGVNNGATWGIFCYRDGAIFDSFVGLWDDGPASQTSRAFCTHDGRPGAFELRAYLGTILQFQVQYSLVGQPPTPAPTAPASPTATP
jgi:hypothetical protein